MNFLLRPRGSSSTTGRADLYRAFAAGGELALAAMASLLGYEEVSKVEAGTARSQERRTQAKAPPEKTAQNRAEALAPLPFWRLERVEHLSPEPASDRPAVAPIGLEGIGALPGRPPRIPPIVSDARLWAALRRRLGSTARSRQLDVRALAEAWSRGRIQREIPYRKLPAWASRVLVLVDGSSHLGPVREDQRRLVGDLKQRLGRAAVATVRFVEGMSLAWRDDRGRRGEPPFEAGVPSLVLSDVGFSAGADRRSFWTDLALRADRAGVPLSAMVPSPSDRWTGFGAHAWNALSWERPERLPPPGRERSEEERHERAERLLGLLAFASRIEPGLLRAARLLLPPGEADLGTEIDAWNLPGLTGGFASAAVVHSAELRERLEERFRAEDPQRQTKAVAALRSWRIGQPLEIWLEEVLALDAAGGLPPGVLPAGDVEAAQDLWKRIEETLGSATTHSLVAEGLRRYVGEAVEERIPKEAWEDDLWAPPLARAWGLAWKGPGPPPLPAGIGSGVLDIPRGEPRRGTVWQVEGNLVWNPSTAPLPAGSPLAALESSDGLVTLVEEGARWSTPRPLGQGLALPRRSGQLLVLTDRTRATLGRLTRPRWAQSIGRDRYGLWATLAVGQARQRMRWIPPGRFRMGSPGDEPGRDDAWEQLPHLVEIENGFWLGETPCTQAIWLAVMGGENPSRFQTPHRPVEQVSWEGCREFIGKLGHDGEAGEIWRLPTEAEWEYACRAGTETATYAGPIAIQGKHNAPILGPIAWYGGNSGVDDLDNGWEKEIMHLRATTHSVARKRANPWGLYDTLGNVWEWCQDAVDLDMTPNSEGLFRVIRGGSWSALARYVRAASRRRFHLGVSSDDFGFRLARGQESALRQVAEPPYRGRPKRGTRRPGPEEPRQ